MSHFFAMCLQGYLLTLYCNMLMWNIFGNVFTTCLSFSSTILWSNYRFASLQWTIKYPHIFFTVLIMREQSIRTYVFRRLQHIRTQIKSCFSIVFAIFPLLRHILAILGDRRLFLSTRHILKGTIIISLSREYSIVYITF